MSGARLLIIGPQGSGKGTQGTRLAGWLGIPAVSTGDVFRDNVARATPLGREVQDVIAAGRLVSDELTERLVRDRLSAPDAADGFLLDGYPRNTAQLQDLEDFLAENGHSLTAVVELRVAREESIRRLEQRALEQGREDDTDEVIAHRLDVYERETAPVVAAYAERGLVDAVDGAGSLDEVSGRIREILAARGVGPDAR